MCIDEGLRQPAGPRQDEGAPVRGAPGEEGLGETDGDGGGGLAAPTRRGASGGDRHEMALRPFEGFVHPDERVGFRLPLGAARSAEEPGRAARVVGRDGAARRLPSILTACPSDGRVACIGSEECEASGAADRVRFQLLKHQAITEAMSLFLESGDWEAASLRVLRAALELTGSEAGFAGVMLEGPRLRMLAQDGVMFPGQAATEGRMEFRRFDNLFGAVVTTGEAVLSNDPALDPRAKGLPAGHTSIRCFLGVPLKRGGEVVGILGVANRPGGYTAAEQRRLVVLGRAAGVICDSYRRHLHERALWTEREKAAIELEERARLATMLVEVGQDLARESPLRALLERAGESLARGLGVGLVRVWLHDVVDDSLEIVVNTGPMAAREGVYRFLPDCGLNASLAAATRRPWATDEAATDPEVEDREWVERAKIASIATFPLMVGDRLLGVLSAADRRPLPEGGRMALMTVAQALAAAVERKSNEQALRQSEERFRSLCGCSPIGIFTCDVEGYCTYVNPRGREIAGSPDDARHGFCWSRTIHASDQARVGAAWADAILALERFEDVYRFEHPEGLRWIHAQAAPMMDDGGKLLGFVGTIEDITRERIAAELLEYQASHDTLTDLPNRHLLMSRLDALIVPGREAESPFALMVLDVDRFKEINDTFGHAEGDAVLRELRPRLLSAVRPCDVVARLEGDEFGVLLPATDRDRALRVAERILRSFRAPVVLDGQALDVTASIGVALCPAHATDPGDLLRMANVAMSAAKRRRCGVAVYAADQAPATPRRLSMVGELREAIENDGLILHYQPKVDLRTMQSREVEALVRWPHPRDGLVSPGEFIPLAEHTGLIRPLGDWTLRAAIRQGRAWRDAGLSVTTAVNLAADHLADGRLVSEILDAVRIYDADPGWLVVEVTESAVMEEPVRARKVLSQLHDLGVRISIDDFGTGYSSLAYLKQLPVDEVKVDQSFVKDMAVNERDASIVRAVIDLGHNLGLKVVAEGVEDKASLDLLRTLGCDLAQGYYFSRPLPPEALFAWMERDAVEPVGV